MKRTGNQCEWVNKADAWRDGEIEFNYFKAVKEHWRFEEWQIRSAQIKYGKTHTYIYDWKVYYLLK